MRCSKCGSKDMWGVEYKGTKEDYDGVSEYQCKKCGTSVGRWSGKILKDGELEPVYGVEK